MKKTGIYKIINLQNDKKLYVGSSKDLRGRKKGHFSELRKNIHKNTYLQNSYNKYGENNFIFEVIEYVEFNEDKLILKNNLTEREQYWIDYYKEQGFELYNLCPKAYSRLGSKQPEYFKIKMSLLHKGNKYRLGHKVSEETKEKMSISAKNKSEDVRRRTSETLKGHKVSEETKEKMRKGNLGQVRTEETKKKLRESHLGQIVTKETREKISKGNKNKYVSEETREKISKAKKGNQYFLGRKHSEETKKKIGEFNSKNLKGRKLSEEHKRKISESLKNRKNQQG